MLDEWVDRQRFGGFAVRGRRRPFRLERSLLVVLIACVAGLSVLAHASPPDPIWIPGIYHSADYDGAVVLLTTTEAVADTPRYTPKSLRRVVTSAPTPTVSPPVDASALGFHLRSPPTV